MARLEQLIDEIKGLRNEANHRSSLRVLNLLQNNKKLFLEGMEEDYLDMATKNFQLLCDTPSREYNTPDYLRDYNKYYESLMFYLNRII
ncbi:hypothetical protein [Aurantibacillus circumpalustris]|uniref:hypothetical protein n=1 Tax=Aurantibacillus circumpalustris TaxID=3036359 RepID=UPI00295BEDE2|nr:hypothetical protein [Aurantibacillus circumpalustris]